MIVLEKDMINAEIRSALLTTQLGQNLDASELDLLIAHSKYLVFSPGEVILQQGKQSEGMYIIINGTALVTAKILGEGGTYITTLQHGNLIGEISLIENGPAATSVLASSQVKCLLITNTYFEILSVMYPQTKYKITRVIAKEVCNRLKVLHRKITSFISHADMTARSMFSEVIKSLTRPTALSFEEAGINKAHIQKSDLFKSFSQEEFDELLAHASIIKVPKQCTLIQEGEKNSPCFLTLRGAVQSSIVENNKTAKLSVLGPYNFLCSISSVDETEASIVNYTSCERALLLKIMETDIIFIRENSIKLWNKLFDIICKSLVEIEKSAEKLDIRLNSELYNR